MNDCSSVCCLPFTWAACVIWVCFIWCVLLQRSVGKALIMHQVYRLTKCLCWEFHLISFIFFFTLLRSSTFRTNWIINLCYFLQVSTLNHKLFSFTTMQCVNYGSVCELWPENPRAFGHILIHIQIHVPRNRTKINLLYFSIFTKHFLECLYCLYSKSINSEGDWAWTTWLNIFSENLIHALVL